MAGARDLKEVEHGLAQRVFSLEACGRAIKQAEAISMQRAVSAQHPQGLLFAQSTLPAELAATRA
jgi:hypothetical protein